jgi:hypothetical protein
MKYIRQLRLIMHIKKLQQLIKSFFFLEMVDFKKNCAHD